MQISHLDCIEIKNVLIRFFLNNKPILGICTFLSHGGSEETLGELKLGGFGFIFVARIVLFFLLTEVLFI